MAIHLFVSRLSFAFAMLFASAPLSGQYVSLGKAVDPIAGLEHDRVKPLVRQAKLNVDEVWLADALTALQQHSGVSLVYSPSRLPRYQVSCQCYDSRVSDALESLLEGSGLEFSEYGEHIVIVPRRSLDVFSPGATLALLSTPGVPALVASTPNTPVSVPSRPVTRRASISGRVIDGATLEPINAARVHISGLEIGTLTNSAGRYTLPNVPAGTHTVMAEVIGYRAAQQTIDVLATSAIEVNFTLTLTALQLEEVVAVGYSSQSRATISGSVSQIGSQEIESSSATTVANALVGKLQGINTRLTTSVEGQGTTAGTGGRIPGDVNDGRPGSASVLQIRNMGAPLFVIDGVPTSDDQEFNQLNPADIETISILKDGSAAVYGFRAANGVVLVNTKRGSREQAARVRMDARYGWQDIQRYHFSETLNAYDFLFSRLDSENNLGTPRSIAAGELEKWRLGGPGYESVDFWDQVYRPSAPAFNVNGSVSGGLQNAQYYLSVGHVTEAYNFRDNAFGRTNLTANLQASLATGLTIGTELRARYELQDNIGVQGNPDIIQTTLLTIHSSWPHEQPYTGPNNDLINGAVRNLSRSIATLSKDVSGWQKDTRRQTSGNLWAEYRFPFGVTAKGTVSASSRLREFDLARRSYDAFWCNADNSVCERRIGSPDRSRSHLKNVQEDVFSNLTLTTAQRFGGHSVTGSAFWEMDGGEARETWVIGQSPTNYTQLISLTNIEDFGNSWDISRRESVGGRADYDYNRKYLVSLLARYDGSYLYAPDKRWGFFPGISVGWRVTEEPFLRDRLSFLDELKLRASWGQTGQERGAANWAYLAGATYNVGEGAVLDGVMIPGTRPRGIPVTNLSWVTSTSRNLGLDFVLLGGRLSGEFDVFERELSGLPAPRTDVLVPQEVGYTLPSENLNSDMNRGIEGMVRWSDRIGSVSYSFAPNFTFSRQTNGVRYGERYGSSWDRYRAGEVDRWSGVNFGYQVIGQFQSVKEIEKHPVDIDGQGNRSLLPGDLIYLDVNGDGIVNAMDVRPIGYSIFATPLISFGGAATVGYAGVSLNLDLAGGALYSHAREAATKFPTGHNLPQYAQDRWYRIDPYNAQSEWHRGTYPPFRNGGSRPSYNRNDDFWLTNVKFLRIRRVEVGYQVPESFSGRFGLAGLRVYTNATNPVSFDNVSQYNLDPEIAFNAALNYPTVSVVNVGFSASLGGARQSAADVPLPR